MRKKLLFKFKNRVLDMAERPYIMGILNMTPDSFYDGGRYGKVETATQKALEMAIEGADMIDIGGQSTRPGAERVSRDEELRRVLPLVEMLSDKTDVPISIDTFDHKVAAAALGKGASILNDISGLTADTKMAKVAADAGAGVILMHIKGAPSNMHKKTIYPDIMEDIKKHLERCIAAAKKSGIDPDNIMVDPGIGFSKDAGQNLVILNRLKELEALRRPVLVGVSRKSFIGKILGNEPEHRLTGTLAACAIAISNGANVLRVHDVREAREAALVADAVSKEAMVVA